MDEKNKTYLFRIFNWDDYLMQTRVEDFLNQEGYYIVKLEIINAGLLVLLKLNDDDETLPGEV